MLQNYCVPSIRPPRRIPRESSGSNIIIITTTTTIITIITDIGADITTIIIIITTIIIGGIPTLTPIPIRRRRPIRIIPIEAEPW